MNGQLFSIEGHDWKWGRALKGRTDCIITHEEEKIPPGRWREAVAWRVLYTCVCLVVWFFLRGFTCIFVSRSGFALPFPVSSFPSLISIWTSLQNLESRDLQPRRPMIRRILMQDERIFHDGMIYD
jgi:hypothetical protein